MTKEIVLFAYKDRIEVWDADAYEEQLNSEPADFSDLAQQVMAKKENPPMKLDVNVAQKPGGSGWSSDQ